MRKILTTIFLFAAFLVIVFTMNVKGVKAGCELGEGNSVDISCYYNETCVRSASYSITDKKQMNNRYDTVNIKNLFGCDVNTLINQKYKTMVIELAMDVWEEKDCYEKLYIYDDSSSGTLLASATFEHGSGKKLTSKTRYIFYCEIELASIQNNDFVIRYAAKGWFSNKWNTSNVKVEIGFSKDAMVTSSIWSLSWDDSAHTYYTCKELPTA